MPKTSPPKAYVAVHVLCIHFLADHDAERNAKQLGRAFKHVGYEVTRITELDLGFGDDSEMFEKSTPKVEDYIRRWLRQRVGVIASPEDRLFIIYFGGHGETWLNRGRLRLVGSFEGHRGGEHEIDLTRIQEIVRNETGCDLLCLFECCHADETDECLEPLEDDDLHFVSDQIVETLAAGVRHVVLCNDGEDFSQRFANMVCELPELYIQHQTVRGLFDRAEDDEIEHREGYYICNQGKPSITLPVCPKTALVEKDDDTVYSFWDDEDEMWDLELGYEADVEDNVRRWRRSSRSR